MNAQRSPSLNLQSALLGLQFFVLVSAFAQTGYLVNGTVRLPDGTPAARVTVRLSGSSGVDRQAFTDDMGRYEIRDLPRGRYLLSAHNPSAPEQITDVAEVDISRISSIRVTVNLFFRAGTSAESPDKAKGASISVAEASQKIPRQAQRAFEQALEDRSKGRHDRSLEQFGRALDIFPEYFQALAERGHLFIALGRVTEASADFNRALALNERYEPALRGAGMCEFQQEKFGEAVKHLELAVAAGPGSATSYLFLGISNLALDHRNEARSALQRALAIDPNGAARAHVHLATLAMKEDRNRDAIAELQAYLSAVPNAPDAARLQAILTKLRSNSQP
jgi:Tfp pilus assembly protein PilF